MARYSREQKDHLSHMILNTLTDTCTARLLKKLKSTMENEKITLSKVEAEEIINNLSRIRQIVIDLPIEEEKENENRRED